MCKTIFKRSPAMSIDSITILRYGSDASLRSCQEMPTYAYTNYIDHIDTLEDIYTGICMLLNIYADIHDMCPVVLHDTADDVSPSDLIRDLSLRTLPFQIMIRPNWTSNIHVYTCIYMYHVCLIHIYIYYIQKNACTIYTSACFLLEST